MNGLTPQQKEAYARVKASQNHISAVEFRHSAWGEPVRLIRHKSPVVVRLESTAITGAGQDVSFEAFGFEGDDAPTISVDPDSQISLRLDGVSGFVQEKLEPVVKAGGKVEVTYREVFYDVVEQGVATVQSAYNLDVRSVSINMSSVSVKAGYSNLRNMSFPDVFYSEYSNPSLAS